MSAPRLAPEVVFCLDCRPGNANGLRLSASHGGWVHVYRPRNGHAPRPAVVRAARDVQGGDRVRVLGMNNASRVTMYVAQIVELDSGDRLLLGCKRRGVDTLGPRSAGVARIVAPLSRVDVLPCECAAPDPQVDGFCARCASVVAR